jgi:hypothetical protein
MIQKKLDLEACIKDEDKDSNLIRKSDNFKENSFRKHGLLASKQVGY